MTTPNYWDSDEAKAELLTNLRGAPADARMDVGGYDAYKLADGTWYIAPDDELATAVGCHTSEQLLKFVCCYHSAHYPVEIA